MENLKVCKSCLLAIDSREEKQTTHTHYIDELDEENFAENSRCQWCEENGFNELYELI